FEKFLRDPNSSRGVFYVQMRRSHYFGNDISDVDELHAFRIQSPIAPYPDAYAFLRKSSPEAQSVLERYRWGAGYRPFVELRWVTPKNAEPRVELMRVIRHTWRR
ncbi:MAG: hypothetical protein ACI9MB_002976, partial [Verrucomicrobiales bacterium]